MDAGQSRGGGTGPAVGGVGRPARAQWPAREGAGWELGWKAGSVPRTGPSWWVPVAVVVVAGQPKSVQSVQEQPAGVWWGK